MPVNRNRLSRLDAAVAEEVRVEMARHREVTLSSIAADLGMRRATLSSKINGRSAFTPSVLAKVAAALGTTASKLVGRAEAQTSGSSDSSAAVAS